MRRSDDVASSLRADQGRRERFIWTVAGFTVTMTVNVAVFNFVLVIQHASISWIVFALPVQHISQKLLGDALGPIVAWILYALVNWVIVWTSVLGIGRHWAVWRKALLVVHTLSVLPVFWFSRNWPF